MSRYLKPGFATTEIFGEEVPSIEDLEGAEASAAKMMEAMFTGIVGVLKDPAGFGNEKVNKLAALFWDLVGNNFCPAAGAPVQSLSFIAEARQGIGHQAFILVPRGWVDTCVEDSSLQMGAMVFVASQAVDFYRVRLLGDSTKVEVMERAFAYERELLQTFRDCDPDFVPNEYQAWVLAEKASFAERPELYYDPGVWSGVGGG